jgi:hypothetical protein
MLLVLEWAWNVGRFNLSIESEVSHISVVSFCSTYYESKKLQNGLVT